jgi:hypothetical protein
MSNAEPIIQSLIESELSRIMDRGRRSNLTTLLVGPTRLSLSWDYGEAETYFDCWVVGRSTDRHVLLVYCDKGFGPTFPWGFVFPTDDSLGKDDQWYCSLEDAAIVAGLIPSPPGHELRDRAPDGSANE